MLLIKILNNLLKYAQILLLILKLTGYINWSWWIVCIPLFIQIGFILVYLVLVWFRNKSMSPLERALRNYYHAVTGKNDWQ